MNKILLIIALLISITNAEIVDGKSGIPAIDTLENHEWDVSTSNKSLPLALLLGIFPGGMQYYFEHYVRAGFMTAITGGLIFDITYSKKIIQDRRIEDAKQYQDSVAKYTRYLLENPRDNNFYFWQSKRRTYLSEIRSINDSKIEMEDLRKVETSWAIGMYIYSYFDGIGIWLHNKRRLNETKSVTGAIWRSALLPGLGQIYNDEWGKAGLMYMIYLGAAVSIASRQDVVEYYEERHRIAKIENNSTQITATKEKATFYRKRRNQFIWGTLLLYLYSLADAAVDASLSDFDSPLFITLNNKNQPTLGLAFNF